MRLKQQDVGAEDFFTGDVMTAFRGYDLGALGIPEPARPRVNGNHMGRRGHTLRATSGAVTRCNLVCCCNENMLKINCRYMLDHQLFLVHQPAQAIEVLLKSRAYVVKRLASAEMDSLADQEIRGRLGQVT